MTKKKFYQQPHAKFIEVKQADIIATSTQANFQSYEEDDNTFSGRWFD